MYFRRFVHEVINVQEHEELVRVNTQYFCQALPVHHPLKRAFEDAYDTGSLKHFTPESIQAMEEEIRKSSAYNKALLLFYLAYREELDALEASAKNTIPPKKTWKAILEKITSRV